MDFLGEGLITASQIIDTRPGMATIARGNTGELSLHV